jgi:hypothetical protein
MSFPCHFVIVVVDVVDVLLFPCLFYIIPAFLASGFSILGFLFFSSFFYFTFRFLFSFGLFGWNLARVLLRPTWFFFRLILDNYNCPPSCSIYSAARQWLVTLFVCLLNTKNRKHRRFSFAHTSPFFKMYSPAKDMPYTWRRADKEKSYRWY